MRELLKSFAAVQVRYFYRDRFLDIDPDREQQVKRVSCREEANGIRRVAGLCYPQISAVEELQINEFDSVVGFPIGWHSVEHHGVYVHNTVSGTPLLGVLAYVAYGLSAIPNLQGWKDFPINAILKQADTAGIAYKWDPFDAETDVSQEELQKEMDNLRKHLDSEER